MDFRFRATDNQPPAAPSSSGCSSDHPLRDDSLNAEFVKQRIKEEIMIREIASRRMLEAEIRRELIFEQELAMHRAASQTDQGLAFDEKFAVRLLDQRLNRVVVDQYSGGLLAVPGSTSLNSLPVRPFAVLQKEESKPLDDEKDKLIFLPKPDPEKFEAKRKPEGPPAQADNGPFPWKLKKANEEFVCRMCNISATSEITFNAHLQGKKHRAKEGSGLEEEEVSKNTGRAEGAQPLKKNGYKFWCETCQIGTQSIVVMETHNNGKKHRARLLKFGEYCKDEPRRRRKFDHLKVSEIHRDSPRRCVLH